jgi:hypothetical protein
MIRRFAAPTVVRNIAVMLIALALAWISLALTSSLSNARRNPALALKMWSGNSLAEAALADQAASDTATASSRVLARGHAVTSLMTQPGNPVAARVMGVTAGLDGNLKGMARWFSYSERYSRRDLPVQLALIELAVQRGQINETLVHYDRALRVFAPQPGLVDVLVAATNEPDVRQALVPVVRRNPPWRQSYLIQLVESGHASPATIYTTLRSSRLDPRQALDRRILGEATALLVGRGKVALARDLTGITSSGVRNGQFEQANLYPPLDWKLTDSTDLSGVVEQGIREKNGNALFVESHNDASGIVAEQVLSLVPGRHVLSLTSGDGTGTTADAPMVTMSCAGRSDIIASKPLPVAKDAVRAFRMSFAVPANCPAQRLAIVATPSSGLDTVRPWIDDVTITRLP